MKTPCVLAVCVLSLFACGGGDDSGEPPSGGDSPSTAEAASRINNGPKLRAFAMRETEALAKRVCGSVPPSILARSLGGDSFPKTDTSPNAIALGYARDVDISPIPLQRAAADGCRAGVASQQAGGSEASSDDSAPVVPGERSSQEFTNCPPKPQGPTRANRVRVAGGATCAEATELWQVAPSQGPDGLPQDMTDQGISGGWVCVAPLPPSGGLRGHCVSGSKEVRYVFY